MKVKSVHGDFTVFPANATDDPANVGPVDLTLFCVKTYNTEEAAETIRPAVGSQTVVISLQNGIDAAERIGNVIGWFHDFGILVGGVIVNMLIDRSQVTAEAPEFVHNRVDMQSRYMEDIWSKFDGMVRSTVPLYETEVRGTSSLTRMGEALFA